MQFSIGSWPFSRNTTSESRPIHCGSQLHAVNDVVAQGLQCVLWRFRSAPCRGVKCEVSMCSSSPASKGPSEIADVCARERRSNERPLCGRNFALSEDVFWPGAARQGPMAPITDLRPLLTPAVSRDQSLSGRHSHWRSPGAETLSARTPEPHLPRGNRHGVHGIDEDVGALKTVSEREAEGAVRHTRPQRRRPI